MPTIMEKKQRRKRGAEFDVHAINRDTRVLILNDMHAINGDTHVFFKVAVSSKDVCLT